MSRVSIPAGGPLPGIPRWRGGTCPAALSSLRSKPGHERARECARSIPEAIRRQEGITASPGIGPCQVVAKIATDFKKPNGLTPVEPDAVREFLAPLPVQKIPGVGPKTAGELQRSAISRRPRRPAAHIPLRAVGPRHA
ncbi:MAG: hypothetical protein QMD46_08950 [Methanomicrobiales archaeon]|nr:hypothetical protein [Methanomicrobiales archaeon]MDI6875495.1 hypothetical protein [Methanomicrobiales archaeon]